MTEKTIDPRYPIGKYAALESYDASALSNNVTRIASLPARLEAAIAGLNQVQLDTPYREGGWTVRQVVHHVADSHMNAYIRVKWALTEDVPTIKAYDEKGWAKTPEMSADPALSILFLKSLHAKWVTLLNGLSESDLSRAFIHPATGKSARIDQMTGMYAWHGDHHLAHITELKKQKSW